MSSGVPVIVTDKMGPKELVAEGDNSFIAVNDSDFAQKLDVLIGDQSLRKKTGASAREYALTRSWDDVFNRLYKYYEKFSK